MEVRSVSVATRAPSLVASGTKGASGPGTCTSPKPICEAGTVLWGDSESRQASLFWCVCPCSAASADVKARTVEHWSERSVMSN